MNHSERGVTLLLLSHRSAPLPLTERARYGTPMTLGTLHRLDPRAVWKHEAHDFTPWLVENIEMLGELLGMDLEVVDREADVGDFSVDILARDLGRDRL